LTQAVYILTRTIEDRGRACKIERISNTESRRLAARVGLLSSWRNKVPWGELPQSSEDQDIGSGRKQPVTPAAARFRSANYTSSAAGARSDDSASSITSDEDGQG
jgi:hypothetical protein